MEPWGAPTVALRNPAARNGPPAAAEVETPAATVEMDPIGEATGVAG
jgi:hypothetical protein